MQEISLAYAAIKWNGRAIEKRCRVSAALVLPMYRNGLKSGP